MRKIGTPLLAIGVAALLLSGCDGIGDGNRPESLRILQAGDDGVFEATECTFVQMTAAAEFTDGSEGVFTDRVEWESSDESVVVISNRDLVAPSSGGTLGSGVLVPVSPGTATVYATLAGSLEAQVDIVVSEISPLSVDPSESTTAVEATRFLRVIAEEEGEEVDDLSIRAAWSFVEEEQDVATIEYAQRSNGSYVGVVSGLAPGELTAVADLDFCGKSVTATVRVAEPQTIELRREYEGSTQLVSGTTEFMYPFALFENGDEQDLDGQVIFSSTDAEVVIVDAFLTAPSLIVAGIAGGPADVTATFGADEPEEGEEVDLSTGITSAPLQVTVVDATLTSLDITPDAPTVMFGESLDFEATGTFDSGAFTQSITRSVGWVTDDDEVAIFGNTFLTANRFFPALNEAGQSIVTATYTNEDDTVVQATETVTIEPQVDEEEDEDDSSDETGLNPGRF